MSVSNRDRIIAIKNCLKNIAITTQRLPDEPNFEAKNTIGQELHMAINLLADVSKAGELTEEFYAQLLQMLGATNEDQAGEIISELQADAVGRSINVNTIRAAEDFIAKHSHAWNTETVHPNTLVTALRAMIDTQRTKIDASWSLHDRVEFALRDAGFELDEAAFVAELAKVYEETKNDALHDRILAILQANGIPEAKHVAEGGALVLALTKILLTVRRRMMFIQQPGEPMWNPTDNKWVPDWRYESQLVEFGLFATPITVAEHPMDTKTRDEVNDQKELAIKLRQIAEGLDSTESHAAILNAAFLLETR